MKNYVGLTRSSTNKQEESGLGLEAGHAEIERFVKNIHGNLVTVVWETMSGTKSYAIQRPDLMRAIKLCKKFRATLVVPRIDRLTRSIGCKVDIDREKVEFIAVDCPDADDVMKNLMVVMGAHEAKKISERCKSTARIYKEENKVPKRFRLAYADGNIPQEIIDRYAGKLGSNLTGIPLTKEARQKGVRISANKKIEEAREIYEDETKIAIEMRADGKSYQNIADHLNETGYPTRTNSSWCKKKVQRLLDRSFRENKCETKS